VGKGITSVNHLDWVWNGRKFVQVSKEWKMSDSSSSIQSALCGLIETVEAATSKVVDQRKLLHTALLSSTLL
jgi:hypothetical protein